MGSIRRADGRMNCPTGALSTWREEEAEMAGSTAVRLGKEPCPGFFPSPLLLGTCQGFPSTTLAESGRQLMGIQSNSRGLGDMNTPPLEPTVYSRHWMKSTPGPTRPDLKIFVEPDGACNLHELPLT